MARTVADQLVQRLAEWGVHRIFGYPGDGITGLTAAIHRAGPEQMQFVQARHEEMAAFMACGHAKYSGTVGVCIATSGPGAIHLLNGLYDARMDHQPVVAIVGQQARSALGGDYQQEVDLLSLFKDVASEFVQQISVPAQLRHVVDRALRIALDRRCVTCIIVPNDVQELPALTELPHQHAVLHSGIGLQSNGALPDAASLHAAAEVLNAGERVAILVGAGALQATDEVLAVAERLGAGIAKSLLGKAVVPDDLPYVTGVAGLVGTAPSADMMQHCDTLLMIGSHFPYTEFLPAEGQARGVQIDRDGRRLGLRFPMEVNLVGDSAATLRELLPLLKLKTDRRWAERIAQQVHTWWRVLENRAHTPAEPVNPQRVFWELSPRLPDDCMLSCDTGTAAVWFARDLKLRRGMLASLSGGLASMGNALPYAIAAKYAHPSRPAIALVGDGAMQMNGLNALLTIAKVWREWRDPRLVVLVLDNHDLNLVTWEQRAAGQPKFEASQRLPEFPYAAYARLIGLEGIEVDRPDDIGQAWDAALRCRRPVLLEIETDPNVPPTPPQVGAEQFRAYAAALLRGDPEGLKSVIGAARDWWAALVPASHHVPPRPRVR
ncbi:thiamine pyrophosphate-requiring protein [Aquincola sp. S2]|uniref:Thiamine pyrophosphate-requiring protein n=1 Tax=Pseudaquabacterium terrae TaxID=2732868 RepID=A0ABX2EHT3_9BURK|nr:thiamine pyrophosphate-requiring protein [Aquabacterium terrae]NRF68193.1 thiamine pyrophosphate-requiring protein [Aquabacterium terrae]